MDTNENKKHKDLGQIRELDLNNLENKSQKSNTEMTPTIKYPVIKRMLNTLDKFLTKKLGLVLTFCTLAIAACSMGLLFNNSGNSNAASGGNDAGATAANLSLNTWLWSGIALFAFFALLSVIYVHSRVRSRKTR